MITVNKIDNSSVRINGHLEDLYVLREWFAKTKKNHFFDPKFKDSDWDGKIRHFNMKEKTLPYGLLGDLFDCLDAHNIGCEIEPKLLKEIESKDITDFEEFAFKNVNPDYLPGGKCEPRDYQDKGAKLILESKRGLLEHATRSGKSLTSFYAVNYIFNKYKETIIEKNIKIMVIVPNTTLILSFSKDYVEYGMDKKYIGRYYKDEKDDTNIIIGTWHSLRKANKMHNDVVFVVGDECHGSKAFEIQTLMKKLKRAKVRLGMTGTLPSDENERMTIMGAFGPILSTVKARELINRGILAEPYIKFMMLEYPRGTDAAIRKKAERIKKKDSDERFEFIISRLRDKLTPYYTDVARLDENIEKYCCLKNKSIKNLIFSETDKKITPKSINKIKKTLRNFNDKTLRFLLEKEVIMNNKNRKKLARNIIKKHGKETMLFLFNEEKFGLEYLHYLKEQYPDKTIHFVNYRIDVKEREKIINEAVEKEGVIIVASLKTFALGITIPNLSVIGLLWGGKSEITVPQALGRGLSVCGTINTVTLYDFSDQLFYAKKHGTARIGIYMKESHKVQIREVKL